jgi:hypothetical protein
MADLKISQLTGASTPLAGTEVLPIVQSGSTKKVSVADLTAGRAISATQMTLTTGNLIVADGQGVDFSATPGTGTSELLNDYEEGTWTPTLVGGTTAGTYSIATTSARYTKIGRQVTVNARMVVTVTSAGTGGAKFGGLPFAKSSAQFMTGSVLTTNVTFGLTVISATVSAWTSGSSSDFTFAGIRSATSPYDLLVTDIADQASIIATFTYFV